jgi:ABC-type Fe3+-hydroxamate transport system substrate-binding protein
MRTILTIAAVAALAAACAPDSEKTNPAVATDEAVAQREATAPAAGANSFTEGQARDRIIAAGYTDVTALAQAEDGTWRGSALMSGQSQSVVLDYQGNVTAEPASSPAPTPPMDPTAPVPPAPVPSPTPQ